MAKFINFNEQVENSLKKLGHEIEKASIRPETKDLSKREILKETIKNFDSAETLRDEENLKAEREEKGKSFLPEYLEKKSEIFDEVVKTEVEKLIAIALNKSIEKAVIKAKQYPPFIEDSFHDALVDKLLPLMEKRGLIKN